MLNPGAVEDRQTLNQRLLVLRVGTVVCLVALAVAFWCLQVLQYETYAELAQNNQLRTIPLRAPRGVLFDRNGTVLVENKYSFTIVLVREQSPTPSDLRDVVKRLAEATGADEARMTDIVRRHRSETFQPIPVIEHASFEQVAAVMARRFELPEIEVQQVPTRTYPEGGFAAHLFGYVGEVSEAQLAHAEYADLQPGAIVGQTGLERTYNAQLTGTDGARFVAVNSKGRELAERGQDDPVDGARLMLTIDYDLQRALETAYKAQGLSGAAVFLDPRNGEILAMTSQPEYDPNDFANGINGAEYNALRDSPAKPLQNRLIQGRYSPGSTFKVLMAVAALSEGIITPDFKVTCTGSKDFYGHTFHCDKKQGHGTLDLEHAIAQSCDVYFYTLASMMKIDTIHKYTELLGLAGKTGIDLPYEADSIVPSTEWKARMAQALHRPPSEGKWYAGETISVGIGQGPLSVTPIGIAEMVTAIANGGMLVTPHVVKQVDMGAGWTNLTARPPRTLFQIPPEVLGPVHEGMWLAVNGGGTAGALKIVGHDLAGKTGTAQVVSEDKKKAYAAAGYNAKEHAWFEFFAPRDEPEIAGAIMVEHGGWGAEAAVPITKFVLDTFYAKKDHKPLPVWPKPAVPAAPAKTAARAGQ